MATTSTAPVLKTENWLRRCYHWTLEWADHPQAHWALFTIAMIEASCFPIPPDLLLIPLALGRPKQGLHFAFLATAGSVIGAALGYAIGMFLFTSIAQPLLEWYGAMGQFNHMQSLFTQHGFWLVLIAGFSPIPFKVITIAAGAFGLAFPPFLLATLISRGARFYLEGGLLRWGGTRIRLLVERYFEWITVAVSLLVVGGFGMLWLVR
ncbi:MAG: YqaA family protein [Mariprofundales bacterium]|nr:YqaA family protein [Mariprofundales bacterium]